MKHPITSNILSRYALTRKDIHHWLSHMNLSSSHSRSLMGYIYDTGSLSTPAKYRDLFDNTFTHASSKLKQAVASSCDKSVKLMIQLKDNELIEAVILREKTRISLCVSSQVGCALGCTFCATARMGWKRDLSCHEIIEQWLIAKDWLYHHDHTNSTISNIVFMGMGEPCQNLKGVMAALDIFLDPWAIAIAPRRITLSSSGYLEGLQAIYQKFPHINYAISLHSTQQTSRAALMPVSRIFPLCKLLDYLKETSQQDKKTFFIQYTLIAGVNDTTQDAQRLAEILRPIRCKINLLTFNPIENTRFKTPDKASVFLFGKYLKESGYQVSIRFSKGDDIDAACGQLITKSIAQRSKHMIQEHRS
ncbi:MAG: 23S rRNA (adenine(2503)-C(2))-methyltransferase RlmN [Proteobacteria bacterium]|nr:23S rRNA (adenine(2503)-C(2))-methyltransferase RlmN [Pseudomonadota bacterium]